MDSFFQSLRVTSGTGAPTADPGDYPTVYTDEDTGDFYTWTGLAWVQVTGGGGGGSPGGSGTEVQYRVNATTFGGIAGSSVSGGVVTFTSAVLVTPDIGTPTAGVLTNCTGLPVDTGVSGLGTGVATALAVNVGSAGAFVVNGGALGTPSSGTLTSCTDLPISTGVSGLGTGVATFLATPSSANLASALTTKTGTGLAVFDTAPTLPTTVTVGAAGGTTGQVLLKGTTSGTVTLSVADAAGTHTIKLPTADGTNGQALTTNGSGQWGWSTISAGITIGTTTITSGTNTRILYNNSGVVGEYTLTGTGTVAVMQTAPTLTGPVTISEAVGSSGLTITGATQTTSQPALNVTQTWNAGAVAFTAMKLNVTNTASAVASYLAQWQVGGNDVVLFSKSGALQIADPANVSQTRLLITPTAFNAIFSVAGTQVGTWSTASLNLDQATHAFSIGGDTKLFRDAANTFGQRNGTNAQRFNLANTFTSASNREDLSLYFSSNVAHIGTTTTGATARVLSIDYGGTTTSAISIPITSGDITIGGSVFPTGYKSADGSAGVSAGPFSAVTSITVKNGIVTSLSGT